MSASEKLRRCEPIYLTVEGAGELTVYDVPLPLIADLVEAAETHAEAFPSTTHPLRNALTALREHLDGAVWV